MLKNKHYNFNEAINGQPRKDQNRIVILTLIGWFVFCTLVVVYSPAVHAYFN